MLLVLRVPTRAVMDVMGWSQASMTTRYQHVPAEVVKSIADQVGSLLWEVSEPNDSPADGSGDIVNTSLSPGN